jgi:hypothetical protein
MIGNITNVVSGHCVLQDPGDSFFLDLADID